MDCTANRACIVDQELHLGLRQSRYDRETPTRARRGRPRADGVGEATVIWIDRFVPQIPRAVRAWVGGDSAGAATTPIRAAAHGEPSVHAFSGRYVCVRLARLRVHHLGLLDAVEPELAVVAGL